MDDPAEREADRMAEAVVGGRDGVVQRCACEEEAKIQRAPGELPEESEEEKLQTKRSAGAGHDAGTKKGGHGAPLLGASTESRISSLRGGGEPLSAAQRAYFEPHFGDLSAVRLHTGPGAQTAAREVSARAFTVGRDIAFGAGEYHPESAEGRRLLAHELTHTVQQGGGVVRRQPEERRQPTLEEQAATIQGMFARYVASADKRGHALIVLRVEHRGTSLSPNLMDTPGKAAESPAGRSPMSEAQASRHVGFVLEIVLNAKSGEWEIEFRRDPRGVLQFQGWKMLTAAPVTAGTNGLTSVASGGDCNESDSNYGQCLSDERERAYKEGILAAGEVADAYYNPFSGGGGIPDFGAFKIWRLRRLREVAQNRTRRHSGAGVPYRVIGPHGRLQGTSVYVLRDANGTVLYVGKGETMNRLRSHIADPKKTDWFGEIAGVEVRATGLNNTQALALEETLIGQLGPLHNLDKLPFQKEFGSTLSLSANLPRSQQSLWFHVILGG